MNHPPPPIAYLDHIALAALREGVVAIWQFRGLEDGHDVQVNRARRILLRTIDSLETVPDHAWVVLRRASVHLFALEMGAEANEVIADLLLDMADAVGVRDLERHLPHQRHASVA